MTTARPFNCTISTNCGGTWRNIVRLMGWSCRTSTSPAMGSLLCRCRASALSMFLGVDPSHAAFLRVIGRGGVVDLICMVFSCSTPTAHGCTHLMNCWRGGNWDAPGSFDESLDMRIYRWASRAPVSTYAVDPRRLCPAPSRPRRGRRPRGITCRRIRRCRGDWEAHGLLRTRTKERDGAVLAVAVGHRAGWHVATGGGSGVMKAANLGAWRAPADDGALRHGAATLGGGHRLREVRGVPHCGWVGP